MIETEYNVLQRTLSEEVSAVFKKRNCKCLYSDISVEIIEPHQVNSIICARSQNHRIMEW